ncbi:uncharacterized protein CBL_04495 [Carabus blaptoides fortunei]
MKLHYLLFLLIFIVEIPYYLAKSNTQKTVIDNVVDFKEFKKLLRTKNNVMVCFASSVKQASQIIKVFREAAITVKGHGTMVLMECTGEAKKICKKMKVNPDPYVLKHYKDGEFNKDYDRRETVSSMVNFMRDPLGDLPWEEDTTANDVLHLSDAQNLAKFLKKETKPVMVMFYAPWCGFCKTLKPEYATAAAELRGHSVLAAIDVNRPENSVIRTQYNITGFPTLLYYQNGQFKFQYEGENNKNGIITFMKDPKEAPTKVKEPEWSDTDSEVVHLNTESFDPVLKEESSVLVHGMLAALDATKESSIATRFAVRGYPTVKYFSYGEFKFDVNVREVQKIVEFMKEPIEPPPPPPPEKPWSEESSEVVHLVEENYKTFLKKKKHVLVMFYAPWCGHCKKAKPEFTAAADKFKDDPKIEFSAIDCTTQQTLCSFNEVKGYPTFKYFSYYNKNTKPYNGGRLEADFIRFMSDPDNPATASHEPEAEDWGAYPGAADVVKLSDAIFGSSIATKDPTLVMFYAPWCSHCKKMKPDYSKAAGDLKAAGIVGKLAVVDCTVNPEVTEKYKITGFPTIKLFAAGRFVSDYRGGRTATDIFTFMKNPFTRGKDEL